jgi:hypothetical protein
LPPEFLILLLLLQILLLLLQNLTGREVRLLFTEWQLLLLPPELPGRTVLPVIRRRLGRDSLHAGAD